MGRKLKTLILGAAGRDFHNFNVVFRDNSDYEVVAFTATQIPDIAGRKYPPELAGRLYPDGISILEERDLTQIIRDKNVDLVVFSYSDASHEHVMHKASEVLAAGANFMLLGMRDTCIESKKPVISICAVRTGCGKSQTARYVTRILRTHNLKTVAIRHPMPYGDLVKQRVQRFATLEDLEKYNCTIEEMEEYEPHIKLGSICYAGVDYEAILREAEKEADVILWDGGNNDLSFYKSDLKLVLVDPHRPKHEIRYHPGEVNFRSADVIIVNKMDTAKEENVAIITKNISKFAPQAVVSMCNSPISLPEPEKIRGKRVLVVEDGPTLTHGEMLYGAGMIAAQKFGAAEIVDPRPYVVGTIKKTFETYPNIGNLLPAMGYGPKQTKDLEATIAATPCDLVLIGTPIDLNRIIKINIPSMRVQYELEEREPKTLTTSLEEFIKKHIH